jgi:hypothetical protein
MREVRWRLALLAGNRFDAASEDKGVELREEGCDPALDDPDECVLPKKGEEPNTDAADPARPGDDWPDAVNGDDARSNRVPLPDEERSPCSSCNGMNA